ncbi:creatininase [Ornithinimicrobium avium]|uniref:Creatininase n=1 Tax=Ornithinimicrobium avium TaxID=2283195 RepID=A0A345NK46_9MICO|nr:creatininase [Ornithinimicrobium avium]AXH95404.1 creatininase [Ornithinimicrobium avium]
MSEVQLSRTDAHRFREWLAAGRRAVILPTGALEQHGPHLPMGTDGMLSGHLAAAVAREVGALVAPAFTFGYKSQQKSGGGDHLTGTTSLDAGTLVQLARDVVGSLLRQGVTYVVVLNGHYENYQFLYEGIDLALRDHGVGTDDERCVLLLSYWDYVSQESLDAVYGDAFPGWDVEHGGVLETSLMLHLEPDLVQLDRAVDHPPAQLPRFDRLPVVPGRTPESGCLSPPTGSTAEHGRMLHDQVVRDLAADLRRELSL